MTMLLSRTPGLVRDVSMVGRAAQVGRRATPAVYGPHPRVFDECVAWWDAGDGSTSGQSLANRGWGGSALDLRLGSTTGADTNDPLWLGGAGDGYAYLPGIAGNYLSVPDAAVLDITGPIELVGRFAGANPAADGYLLLKGSSYGTRAYSVVLRTTGVIGCWCRDSAGTGRDVNSTAAHPHGSSPFWWKVTVDPTTGAVMFYTAADQATEPSFSQLGTTVTTTYTGSALIANNDSLLVGNVLSGSAYRSIVRNGIDGTTVLDINVATDCTSAAATTFTATTGQTVTINRATSGRKTVISPSGSRPRYLFGTDDYMECADNDLIDFGATDSFTAWVIVRTWNTLGTGQPWMNKRETSGTLVGWQVRAGGGGFNCESVLDDGPTSALAFTPSWSAGSLSMIANVTNRSTQLVTSALNGTFGSGVSCASVGSVANSVNLRIGAGSPPSGTYADFEFLAAGICRRALTAGELYAIAQYYGATA